ncbi:MAG: cobalamin-binding protein, partial [Planctomycetia bacterium]|nr:cobalamin-binding protein [Planctomycetia bacterium]
AGPARLYALDGDNLARLAPDLIITQATCAVCAVAADDVRAALAGSGTHARVLELSPTRLADLYADILAVGMATGALARARELVARLKARVMSVRYRVRPATPVRVAVVEWLDPPMAAGNWVPELVDLAGGIDPLGEAGRHSHWITWDDVIAADPDAVVLIPCGFTIDRVVAEAGRAAIRNRLEMLRAWREGRVYAVDGHHLFNRPGPRLVDSLEVLAELLHPGMFSFAATRRFTKKL